MSIHCFVFEYTIWAEFSGMVYLCSAWNLVGCCIHFQMVHLLAWKVGVGCQLRVRLEVLVVLKTSFPWGCWSFLATLHGQLHRVLQHRC